MIEKAFGVSPGYRSRASFEFPASEIQMLREESEKPVITVNFMGLAGALGPLPHPFSELVISDKSGVAAAFLDIFNNRLIELLYEARKRHEPPLTSRAPHEGAIANHLFALMGLGNPRLRKSAGPTARSLPVYAGLLARPVRTAAGLEKVLQDHFGVPVRVAQFTGRWRPLEPEQLTHIAARGQNQRLGKDAVIGKRVWDDTGTVTIAIGPLHLNEYLEFLPGAEPSAEVEDKPLPPPGARRAALENLIRFCLGPEHTAEIDLQLKAPETPSSVLSPVSGPRLGFTSFLKPPETAVTGDPVVRAED